MMKLIKPRKSSNIMFSYRPPIPIPGKVKKYIKNIKMRYKGCNSKEDDTSMNSIPRI